MDDNALTQFVKNMRDKGVEDDEIAQNLSVAGHPQQTVDYLLGRQPETVAAREEAEAASPPPTVDPGNRPQIIKDRSSIIKPTESAAPQGEPSEPQTLDDPRAQLPTAANQQTRTVARQNTLQPTGATVQPASVNSPTTSAVNIQPTTETLVEPTAEVAPTQPEPAPNPAPATDETSQDPNSFDAVVAQTSEPTPSPTPTPIATQNDTATPPPSIYPDATQGLRSEMPSSVDPGTGMPANVTSLEDASPVKFNSNPIAMLGYAVSRFFMHIPSMLVLLVWGTAVTFGAIRLLLWSSVELFKFIGEQDWLGDLFQDNIVGAFAFIYFWLVLLYVAIITLWLSVWRTMQLSITLDIARDDTPEIGSAFNRLISWSTRAFFANFRLVGKIAVVYFVVLMLYIWQFSDGNWELALNILEYGLYGWGLLSTLLIIRNSFIHHLMLDSGSNYPGDAAKQSVQLVHQPRQKYFELLAWLGVGIILVFLVRLGLVFLFEFDAASWALIFIANLYEASTTRVLLEFLGISLLILISVFYDLGLSRFFIATQHTVRTARQIGGVHVLNFAIILIAATSVWGGNQWINKIRTDQVKAEYSEWLEEAESSRSRSNTRTTESDFNAEDYDRNGIPDQDQCPADTYAIPSYVETDPETLEAVYEIECI